MINYKDDSKSVEKLYQNLINSWNTRNAKEFAECFALGGSSIGFDGSQANGKEDGRSPGSPRFTEKAVTETGLFIEEGHTLMDRFLGR
jgi:uncharacterized protein (TIGR02246 family)